MFRLSSRHIQPANETVPLVEVDQKLRKMVDLSEPLVQMVFVHQHSKEIVYRKQIQDRPAILMCIANLCSSDDSVVCQEPEVLKFLSVVSALDGLHIHLSLTIAFG